MKKGIILAILIVAITATTGFSNSQSTVKETRDVNGFTKVSFGVRGNLFINFGPDFKVVLEGEKALLDDIVTEVSGVSLSSGKKTGD